MHMYYVHDVGTNPQIDKSYISQNGGYLPNKVVAIRH